MSIQSIFSTVNSSPLTDTKKTMEKKENLPTPTATGFDETAVVYEKKPIPENTISNKKPTVDREAIIKQMKAEQEARMNQLTEIVHKMMTQQGQTVGLADDMWAFLAKGDFTVTAEVKAQAQEDISEDGYWGVEKTSDRILDFAKALSGDDVSKADELLEAFKKGYEEATKAWGDELPELCKKTFEAVEKKFDAWKKEVSSDSEEPKPTTPAEPKPEVPTIPEDTKQEVQ